MSYLLGGIAGLVYGGIMGVIKYLILWRNIATTDVQITMGALYARFGISFAISFAVLLVVFLFRKMLPFDFFATLLATAIGLTLSSKLVPLRDLSGRVKE